MKKLCIGFWRALVPSTLKKVPPPADNKLGTYYKFKQDEQQEMKSNSILFGKPLLKAQNYKTC